MLFLSVLALESKLLSRICEHDDGSLFRPLPNFLYPNGHGPTPGKPDKPTYDSDLYRPDNDLYRPDNVPYRPDNDLYRPDPYRPESEVFRPDKQVNIRLFLLLCLKTSPVIFSLNVTGHSTVHH